MSLDLHSVTQHAQEQLDRHAARLGTRLFARALREEEGLWYVAVHPERVPEYTTPYYEILAIVESDLHERGVDVLFVPVDPEDTDAAGAA